MSVVLPLLLAAVVGPGGSGIDAVAMRTVVARANDAASASALLSTSLLSIPPWARKYNMNCDGCHYPAPPRLNATGMQFKWAGYRMPDEFNDTVTVSNMSNYLGVRGRLRYDFAKPDGQPTTTSTFRLNDISLFLGGPLGHTYSGWFEFEREGAEVAANFAVSTIWGKEGSFGGLKAGNFHYITKAGIAGFDRPVGITGASPLTSNLTAAVPFAFPDEQLGLEAFYVMGRNRLSAMVLNGINREGEPTAVDEDTKKDVALLDQLLIDDKGSGLTGTAYYGSVRGLDTLTQSGLDSHFWRIGLSANKIFSNFEALGGFVLGKDTDLPTSLGMTEDKGMGYWVSAQYAFPKSAFTLYGRYEFVDPNTAATAVNDSRRRYVVGALLPLALPQYLRLNAEYWLNVPEAAGGTKKHNVTAEVMIVF